MRRSVQIPEPTLSRFLFADARIAWLWLLLRLYAGWQWLSAGLGKLHSPAWTGKQAGSALSGFVQGALKQASGAHPNVQAWYASFLRGFVLPHAATMAHLVAVGETVVGVALILGFLTGIAAFTGSFMNVNYLLAGTVSTNPILFVLATWLVLAWRNAGWWGLDRWVLPFLGTPWQPGELFRHRI